MLSSYSVCFYLDQNMQQIGQIPIILWRLSCQLTFQLSAILIIQKKGIAGSNLTNISP